MSSKVTAVLAVLLLLWLTGVVGGDERDARSARDTQGAVSPDASATPKARNDKEPTAATPRRIRPAPRTYVVVRVVDGDTVELGNGETVRLVGIDTPEVGVCGAERATVALERLVLGRRVRLTVSDEDRDRYGRLLRYVDVGPRDAGLRLVEAGLAVARYDSRDGYGFHPREPAYVAADLASPDVACPGSAPGPRTFLGSAGGGGGGGAGAGGCAPGYRPCVPAYPPDLDCGDLDGAVRVTGRDPHGLDEEGDGVGCE